MISELEALRSKAASELAEIADTQLLEEWRQEVLGRKGQLTQILRGLGQLSAEERPKAGQLANQVKNELQALFETKQDELKQKVLEASLAADAIDVRLPGRPQQLGTVHIINQTLRDIYDIFGQMGFEIERTPEVEDDMTNFQLLNFPPHHPARDMQDTFYTTNPDVLLRTHTSPGQVRTMRKYYPEPIRAILPGKCYRYEQVTSRSEFMFHQVEGIVVGKGITMGDLRGVIVNFARQMFGADRKLRFRASYFPFTEPGAEADMDCILCGGAGCTLCKHTGWLEIMGCGMIHPNVLRNGGYDPKVYSGFALGMGPERIAMLRHGISDIRMFYGNDLRFLTQFN